MGLLPILPISFRAPEPLPILRPSAPLPRVFQGTAGFSLTSRGKPMMSWSYNEKYCGGGMYVLWNDKGPRTIIGIAAGHNCLACGKQGYSESITELMVRVETGGTKPLVFAPLVVGTRDKTWRMDEFSGPGVDPKMLNEPDCKLGGSATSLTEKWPSDDEVILSGGTGTGGPIDTTIKIGVDAPLAAPGRYRFVR